MKSDKPIRSPDTQALLEGKVTAQELEARDKAKVKAAANFIRRPLIRRPLTTTPAVKLLSLAEQRARSRWQKPLAAIIANAKAVNVGLFDRLTIGVHGPDFKAVEIYQATFNELYEATKKQIEALEIFCRVKWSD
jgi:hypothetical protein